MTDQERLPPEGAGLPFILPQPLLSIVFALGRENFASVAVLINSAFTAGEKAQAEKDQQAIVEAEKQGMRELAEWVNAHIGLWDKKWQAKLAELEKEV